MTGEGDKSSLLLTIMVVPFLLFQVSMYRKAGRHPLIVTLLLYVYMYFCTFVFCCCTSFFVQVRAGRQDGKGGRGRSAEKGGGGDEASYGGKEGSSCGESAVR